MQKITANTQKGRSVKEGKMVSIQFDKKKIRCIITVGKEIYLQLLKVIMVVFLENTGRSTKETMTVRIQHDSGNKTNVRITFIYQQQQTEDIMGTR